MDKIQEFQKILGINFNNKELLKTALIHKSWSVENKGSLNNERLEFLGDSVLAVIIAEYLYTSYPNKNEGELSKLKSVLVSRQQLSKWAKEINLDKFILISTSEEASGGRKKETILAGAFEALLGAIYLDCGIEKCKEFIVTKFLSKGIDIKIYDYKSLLQEILQKEFKILPEYEIVKETGPDHDKEFECIVKIADRFLGSGKGKTKKQAQQNAAKEALKNIKKLKI